MTIGVAADLQELQVALEPDGAGGVDVLDAQCVVPPPRRALLGVAEDGLAAHLLGGVAAHVRENVPPLLVAVLVDAQLRAHVDGRLEDVADQAEGEDGVEVGP